MLESNPLKPTMSVGGLGVFLPADELPRPPSLLELPVLREEPPERLGLVLSVRKKSNPRDSWELVQQGPEGNEKHELLKDCTHLVNFNVEMKIRNMLQALCCLFKETGNIKTVICSFIYGCKMQISAYFVTINFRYSIYNTHSQIQMIHGAMTFEYIIQIQFHFYKYVIITNVIYT